VPMAGEDVAFEACVSAGQAVRIANRLRVEINLDPRRGTSYHRYGVACQRFSKINPRCASFCTESKSSCKKLQHLGLLRVH